MLTCRSFDYFVGYLLFGFLFFFSFLGFMARIQATLLFNTKFAKSLKRGHLMVRPSPGPQAMAPKP